VAIRWPFNWSSSDRNGGLPHDYWHGTLLDGKRDGSGFRYARNRYYDALTGRFTQEDPSGLAGDLNAYGFTAGDPINFGDPFGLGPDDNCEAHGFEDWPEYILIGYVPNTTTPVVVTKWHDCSQERKGHEEAKCLAMFAPAPSVDPCTDDAALADVARCGLDEAWTIANVAMDVSGGAKLVRLTKLGLVSAGLQWAWGNSLHAPENAAVDLVEGGTKGELQGRGPEYAELLSIVVDRGHDQAASFRSFSS
jgi:RHS repeat-associated protein